MRLLATLSCLLPVLSFAQVEEVRRAIPVEPAAVTAEEEEAGATTVVLAYDTHYMFRGANYGRHIVSTDISHSFGLSERWSALLGTWLAHNPEGINGSFSEADFYGRLDYTWDDWVIGLTSTLYTYYDVPWALEPEVGIHLDRTLAGIDWSVLGIHDFQAKGQYAQLSGTRGFECTDWLQLEPAAVLALNNHYFIQGSGWSHLGLSLAASVQLAKHTVLRPYVTYNVALDAAKSEGLVVDQLFGGISLALDF
jgi:hypothetical protein